MNEETKLTKEYEAIVKVQEDKEEALLDKQNVVGIAVGNKIKGDKENGDTCLTVFVAQKLDTSLLKENDVIPTTIGKYKTDVVETGEIFAGNFLPGVEEEKEIISGNLLAGITEEEQEEEILEETSVQALRGRIRPVEGGYSIGHYRITAGTYATAVTDRRGSTGKYYILSNNHVLANSNNARIGDPILQPGPYDGGVYPRDLIARLSRFVTIRFRVPGLPENRQPANLVDAAIAEGQFHNLDREIYWMGYVKGLTPVKIGTPVQKTGRTTNYTKGRVTNINGTINVNYGGGKIAKFVRQIITTNMSAGGDSGSLLCDTNEKVCGLLFAGSSSRTIHNNIFFVQSCLGINIV